MIHFQGYKLLRTDQIEYLVGLCFCKYAFEIIVTYFKFTWSVTSKVTKQTESLLNKYYMREN